MKHKKIIVLACALLTAISISSCKSDNEEALVNYMAPDATVSLHFDGNLTNDGTAQSEVKNYGTLGYKEKGILNQAFTFTDGYLEFTYPENLNFGKQFSVSMWFKGNDVDSCVDPILFGREPSSGEINEGPLCLCFYNGYTYLKTDVTFKYPDGEYKSYSFHSDKVFTKNDVINSWNNIVAVLDNDTFYFYLNGKILNQERLPVEYQNYEAIATNSKPFFIGRAPIGNYSGYIDEFKLYNTAISEKSVELIYREGIQQYTNVITLTVEDTKYTVNGSENKLTAAPVFGNDKECAMIPAKDLIEAMGGKYDFDKQDSHGRIDITYKDNKYSLWIMDTNAASNQTHIKLDTYPFINDDGKVMMPITFLSKQLSANVRYDAKTKVYTIEY